MVNKSPSTPQSQAVPAGPYPTYQPQPTNGLAIASMVLGIVSFVMWLGALTGIPAIITGAIALKRPDKSGRGMAIAGLIMGIASTAITVLAALGFIIALIIGFTAVQTSGGYTSDDRGLIREEITDRV